MDHHFVPFACDFMMKQVAINLRFLFGLIVANKSKKANINWKFAKKSQLILWAAIFGHVCDFVMNNVVLNLNFYLEWLLPTIREKTNINWKFTKTSQLILWTTMFWTCLCDFVMRGCYKLESPIWIDCCQHLENNNWKFICACSSLFMDDHF